MSDKCKKAYPKAIDLAPGQKFDCDIRKSPCVHGGAPITGRAVLFFEPGNTVPTNSYHWECVSQGCRIRAAENSGLSDPGIRAMMREERLRRKKAAKAQPARAATGSVHRGWREVKARLNVDGTPVDPADGWKSGTFPASFHEATCSVVVPPRLRRAVVLDTMTKAGCSPSEIARVKSWLDGAEQVSEQVESRQSDVLPVEEMDV